MTGQLFEGDHVLEVTEPFTGAQPQSRSDLATLVGSQSRSIRIGGSSGLVGWWTGIWRSLVRSFSRSDYPHASSLP